MVRASAWREQVGTRDGRFRSNKGYKFKVECAAGVHFGEADELERHACGKGAAGEQTLKLCRRSNSMSAVAWVHLAIVWLRKQPLEAQMVPEMFAQMYQGRNPDASRGAFVPGSDGCAQHGEVGHGRLFGTGVQPPVAATSVPPVRRFWNSIFGRDRI